MARRNDRRHRIWAVQVIRRDKCCVICGSRKNRQAHHLHDYSSHPWVRYEPDNGVCLCGVRGCHTKFHCDYKKSFKQKCTMDDFLNFKSLMEYAKETFRNGYQRMP